MVILGVVIGGWLAIACSSGGGGIIAVGDGYDTPPNGRENPGPGREAPPSSVDNPGNQGGGPAGGGEDSNCPACAGKLSCVTSAGKKKTFTFSTDSAGRCSLGDGVTLDCTGRILLNGQPIGTWTGSDGNYTVAVSVGDEDTTYKCTPATNTPPASTPTMPPSDAGSNG